jgi:predicted  nucleic acid-binding Zn-ribbon protein
MINVEKELADLQKRIQENESAQGADHAQIEKLTRILYEAFPSLEGKVGNVPEDRRFGIHPNHATSYGAGKAP